MYSTFERISYDAYSKARHHTAGDLDGNGATGVPDLLLLQGNSGNYGVGDLNRDGIVNSDDSNILLAVWSGAIAEGQLSSGGTDNIIGYAGYVFNTESPGAANGYLYTVRHRHYEPGLGRWLERDPLGYVDGMGLYEYVRSAPATRVDFTGLMATPYRMCGTDDCNPRRRDLPPPGGPFEPPTRPSILEPLDPDYVPPQPYVPRPRPGGPALSAYESCMAEARAFRRGCTTAHKRSRADDIKWIEDYRAEMWPCEEITDSALKYELCVAIRDACIDDQVKGRKDYWRWKAALCELAYVRDAALCQRFRIPLWTWEGFDWAPCPRVQE